MEGQEVLSKAQGCGQRHQNPVPGLRVYNVDPRMSLGDDAAGLALSRETRIADAEANRRLTGRRLPCVGEGDQRRMPLTSLEGQPHRGRQKVGGESAGISLGRPRGVGSGLEATEGWEWPLWN